MATQNKKTAATKNAGNKKNKHASRISRWYRTEDTKVAFKRKRLIKKNPTKLRKSIVPGSVLILLAGRFRGKRVVFLKQLASGLLLVTGPFKLNGVPLKRVNQAYVQPTKTKVDVSKINVSAVDDAYFKRVAKNRSKNEWGFFKSKDLTEKQVEAKKTRLANNKKTQNAVDSALIAEIKKTEFLSKYLSARFSITNSFKPHAAKF